MPCDKVLIQLCPVSTRIHFNFFFRLHICVASLESCLLLTECDLFTPAICKIIGSNK